MNTRYHKEAVRTYICYFDKRVSATGAKAEPGPARITLTAVTGKPDQPVSIERDITILK